MSVSAPAVSTLHLHNIWSMGPADVPQDGGDDEVHVGEAVLFPGTTEVWTKGPANVKIEAGQVLLPVAGAS